MATRRTPLYSVLATFTLLFSEVASEPGVCNELRQVFNNVCTCSGAIINGYESRYPVMTCSNMSLTAVPDRTKNSSVLIHQLLLDDNDITSLGADAFAGLKITELDLSGNSLASVDSHAFRGLVADLEILLMDGDSNSLPPSQAFADIPLVKKVTLRNYKVENVDENHNFFLSFQEVTDIKLENWGIISMHPMSFIGLHNIKTLTIENQPMLNLPVDALNGNYITTLEKLVIRKTSISSITNSAFHHLDALRELDLSQNHISALEENCFSGVEDTLEIISLHSQTSTNNFVFTGLKDLPKLMELDMSSMENLRTFPDLSQLRTSQSLVLDISRNKITSLDQDALSGITAQLQVLDLTRNKINTIHPEVFRAATALEELRLDEQFEPLSLPPSLEAAARLKRLHLSGQQIIADKLWPVVRKLEQLEVLDLDNAELTSIPDDVFLKLNKLRELHLNYNFIATISQSTFVGPWSTLEHIYLSRNTFTALPACAFHQYTVPKIKMTLQGVDLTCNCGVLWLKEAVRDGRIEFTDQKEPTCGGTPLSGVPSNTLDCSGYTEPVCNDYTVIPPTDPVQTTTYRPEEPELRVSILERGRNFLSISWTITGDRSSLEYYSLSVTNSEGKNDYLDNDIPSNVQVMLVPQLREGTHYTVCAAAYFSSFSSARDCTVTNTKGSATTVKPSAQSGSDDDNVGIIVGAVVGGVVLLAVLAAIVYLLCLRRRPKKAAAATTSMAPVQPRHFEKSELPAMSAESKTFTRPKKRPGSSEVDGAEGMQVVAISDGQMSSNGRVGRAEQLVSGGSYKPMSDLKRTSGKSVYENDHGPLPATPTESEFSRPPGYYYNEGFVEDKYDEIPSNEIML